GSLRVEAESDSPSTISSQLSTSASHRFFADLFRANANRVFHRKDKNFSVANLAGFGRADNCGDCLLDHVARHHDFDLHFGQEIDGIFAAAINLSVAFLATETFHFGHGHAFNAE